VAAAQLARSPGATWDGASAPVRASDPESRSLQRADPPADVALAHVVDGRATLYNRSDSTAPVATLPVRTPVRRLDCTDAWCRVRTETGRTGFVPAASVSNVWIHVSKADQHLALYRGPRLVETFEIDVGYNTFADKKRQGSPEDRDHWRTPEGVFYVVDKRPQSEFYKALVLNYPTTADAERGLEQGLISQSEYDAIVQAQDERRMPPMGTELGGWIEIHGEGTGGATNWTQGCVAVQNQVMNTLWLDVAVGTPVLIE
jgi:Uncharacterized protein conserved in bacteria